MEYILMLLLSVVICCRGGSMLDLWSKFDVTDELHCPNVYPLLQYAHISKHSTSSKWSLKNSSVGKNASEKDNIKDVLQPTFATPVGESSADEHQHDDGDTYYEDYYENTHAHDDDEADENFDDDDLPAGEKDPVENPDDFFYDSGDGYSGKARYRGMRKTPWLPDINLYESKAEPLSEDDPYINAPITRLPYGNISYIKDYKRKPVAIGSGTFAHVYLAKVVLGDKIKEAAVKILLDYTPAQIFHEARLLGYLKDTGLFPEIYGVARNDVRGSNSWALVQEYYANGETAWDFLHNRGRTFDAISPHNWIQICIDLAEGIQKIHSKHVLFNDLKSNNMLLAKEDGRFRLKLIDVGASSYRKGHAFAKSTEEERKEMDFLAPEAHDGQKTTVASDVFSLGYFIYEVGDMTDLTTLLPLGNECLAEDPKKRPSVQEIINSLKLIQQRLDQESLVAFPRTPALPDTNVPKSKVPVSLYNTSDPFVTTPVTRIPSSDVKIVVNTRGRPVEVGKGTFAKVYLADLNSPGGDGGKKRVVLKVLKKPRAKQIIHELKMYQFINQTDLFPVTYGITKVTLNEKTRWALVQEYYGNGLTMWDLLYKRVYYDSESWIIICLKIAEGLKSFHDKGVLFNDFKTDNILLRRRGKNHYGDPVIVDVGHTSYKQGFEYEESSQEERETMKYLSPEAHDGIITTAASDVYSLGYTLYEVYDYAQMYVLKELSEECMETKPEDRPSLEYVIEHLKILLDMVQDSGDIYPDSPVLPDAPFYDTKAEVDDEWDPYMAAPINRISRAKISFVRNKNGTLMLGRTSHSVVLKAKYKNGGKTKTVAVKIMKPPKYKQLVHEIRVLECLKGVGGFIKMYGIVRTAVKEGSQLEWGLVQEHFANGQTLWDALSKIDKKKPISAETKIMWRKICLNMAKTMRAVHAKDVLLNDFKATNVLVSFQGDADFDLRYIDLGVASYKKGFEYAVSTDDERSNIPHLAPEAHDGYVTTQSSDVYSLGYAIHHIATTTRDVNLMKTCILCVAREESERPSLDDIVHSLVKLIAKRS